MATYATKCNKQLKPALQQTASPALQQQIEPKKPKMLQQHKLLKLHCKEFFGISVLKA